MSQVWDYWDILGGWRAHAEHRVLCGKWDIYGTYGTSPAARTAPETPQLPHAEGRLHGEQQRSWREEIKWETRHKCASNGTLVKHMALPPSGAPPIEWRLGNMSSPKGSRIDMRQSFSI